MTRTDAHRTTYANTLENANRIGWLLVPEYCWGLRDAAYVTHDRRLGEFIFHDEPLTTPTKIVW